MDNSNSSQGDSVQPRPDGYTPPPDKAAQGAPTQPVAPGYQPPVYGQQQGEGQGYPPQGYQQPPVQPGGQYGPPPGYPQQQYAYPPQPVQPVKKGLPPWAWILIGLAAVIVLGCGACGLASIVGVNILGNTFSSIIEPTVVAQEFYTDLEAGKYSEARSLLSSDFASRPENSAAELERRWTALGTITPGSFTNFDTQNDRTTLTWTLMSSGGQNYTITIKLQKIGSDWKITGADPALVPEP